MGQHKNYGGLTGARIYTESPRTHKSLTHIRYTIHYKTTQLLLTDLLIVSLTSFDTIVKITTGINEIRERKSEDYKFTMLVVEISKKGINYQIKKSVTN
jgi:hypothetical protein